MHQKDPQKIKIITLMTKHQMFRQDLLTNLQKSIKSNTRPTRGLLKLPKKKTIITVLKSPFIKKKAREQYIKHTYRGTLNITPPISTRTLIYLGTGLQKGIQTTTRFRYCYTI
jgi:ribosomal protein S10